MEVDLARSHQGNLRRLLLFRVVTATALLLPALYYQLLVGSETSLFPVYTLIAGIYGVSLAWVVVQARMPHWRGLVPLQLTVDVILATALVHTMGGTRSPLVLLYMVIAFAAGAMTSRQTALALACLTGVLYGLAIHLALAGWLPAAETPFSGSPVEASPPELYLRIFLVLLFSCAVAAVSSASSDRLHRARAALRQERSALDALRRLNDQLLAGMSSGLIAADAAGVVVACNRAAERITERSEGELVGHRVADIFGLSGGGLGELDQRLQDRQIYRTERMVTLPGGGTRSVGMSITRVEEAPIDRTASAAQSDRPDYSPGGPWVVRGDGPMAGGYIFMFQDLTDIKRMERVFWMRERMALLGEMAGSLAHEIRNPLASISGSLQMLRQEPVAGDRGRAARLMEIVTKESDRLSRIIEDFLDYARPEHLEAVDVDLVELAGETIELLSNSPELTERHVLALDPETGEVRALVDAARVKQVFWNLARNAIAAMPGGGALTIRIQRTPTGAEVVFEDEGVGMSPSQVDRIFRPFVSDKGTGLGLAIVYRIMELHGARVEVESEPGKGSRFLLQFEDANVPAPGEPVVVEAGTDRASREFNELRRAVRRE